MKATIACWLCAVCSAGCLPTAGMSEQPVGDGGGDDPGVAAPDAAPPFEEELLFARVAVGREPHVIGVTALGDDELEGVDLTATLGLAADGVALVADIGFDAAAAAVAAGATAPWLVSDLLPPVVAGDSHVAAAENYPAHADEVSAGLGGESTPYLFPKIVTPTAARSSVVRQDGELLDYEVELCFLAAQPLASESDLDVATLGFVLCNDLSDRAIQIRAADMLEPEAAAGYTDAKSKPGFLPLGPVVVVPRVWRDFVATVELELHVNGALRQKSLASEMTWDPARIVAETVAIAGEERWTFAGAPVGLTPGAAVPPGILVVTGTPGGVVFRPPSQAFIAAKLGEYVMSGGPLTGMGPDEYVKEAYVADQLMSGDYLAPGDELELCGSHLGVQRVLIE